MTTKRWLVLALLLVAAAILLSACGTRLSQCDTSNEPLALTIELQARQPWRPSTSLVKLIIRNVPTTALPRTLGDQHGRIAVDDAARELGDGLFVAPPRARGGERRHGRREVLAADEGVLGLILGDVRKLRRGLALLPREPARLAHFAGGFFVHGLYKSGYRALAKTFTTEFSTAALPAVRGISGAAARALAAPENNALNSNKKITAR